MKAMRYLVMKRVSGKIKAGRSRTKMSAIVDMASSGMEATTEMRVSGKTVNRLQRAFNDVIDNNEGRVGLIKIECESGVGSKGPAVFKVIFGLDGVSEDVGTEKGEDEGLGKDTYTLRYIFRMLSKFKKNSKGQYVLDRNGRKIKERSNYLNVSCNPTRLVRGRNALPVLIAGRTPLETFGDLLRLPYTVLEDLLSGAGFKWVGADGLRLEMGEITLQMIQIAFYSGDMGSVKKRTEVMEFLSSTYGGMDATLGGGSKSIGATLGLEFTTFPDIMLSDGSRKKNTNFRVVAKMPSGKRTMSMTAYCKDEVISIVDKDIGRLKNLIRFDCTLYAQLLADSNISTVSDLEDKYKKMCDLDGYDIGFTRWLSRLVFNKVKLKSILSVDRRRYYKSVAELEDSDTLEAKIYKEWRETGGIYFPSQESFVTKFGSGRKAISRSITSLKKDYGIDTALHPSFIDAMFLNQAVYSMTSEERNLYAKHQKGDNQLPPEIHELHERAAKRCDVARKLLLKGGGLLRIKKFSTKKISKKNFHIIKRINTKRLEDWA